MGIVFNQLDIVFFKVPILDMPPTAVQGCF